MKKSAFFSAALLAATFGGFGCGAEPQVVYKEGPAKVVTVTKEAPVQPAPKLVGLPLTGSQIDVLGEIEFDKDSDKIRQTPQTIGILTTMANAGRAYPQITLLRVEGHTDSDGNEAANQNLSERRALAVVNWLVERGIERNRLKAVGCGSRDPEVPNDTAEHKQRNRRTEFDIEEVGGQPFELATQPCHPNPQRRLRR
jgi:outer membrane protein OmpA-like peptidoglycan-associated protein